MRRFSLPTDRNTNVLRYCPTSDSWSVFQTCPVHIRKQQMLSVEDTIYLVGGYTHQLEAGRRQRRPSQTEDVLSVQSYNVSTGVWVQLKENTSKSGLNLTCTLHNDGVYIMSRDIGLPTCLDHRVFLKYNIFSDAWEAFRRFPALGQNMLLCSLYLPNTLWPAAHRDQRNLQTKLTAVERTFKRNWTKLRNPNASPVGECTIRRHFHQPNIRLFTSVLCYLAFLQFCKFFSPKVTFFP